MFDFYYCNKCGVNHLRHIVCTTDETPDTVFSEGGDDNLSTMNIDNSECLKCHLKFKDIPNEFKLLIKLNLVNYLGDRNETDDLR